MINFRQLEIFRAVGRTGTLSAAARELALTQPAVSLQMKQLQTQLRTPLFRRRGRQLKLTEAGETLNTYAARLLRLREEAESAVSLRSRRMHLVHIATSSTPGVHLLPSIIAQFRRRKPDTTVRLQVLNTEMVEERVSTRDVDFGIVGGQLTRAQLVVEPWREDELLLIVPPTHPFAGRRTVRARDLAGENLLSRERGSATRATYEAAFLQAGIALPRGNPVGSTEAIKQAVAAGMGVGIVSRFSVAAELRAGTLRAARIRGVPLIRPLFILRSPTAPLRDAALDFLDFLRTTILRKSGSEIKGVEPSLAP